MLGIRISWSTRLETAKLIQNHLQKQRSPVSLLRWNGGIPFRDEKERSTATMRAVRKCLHAPGTLLAPDTYQLFKAKRSD